MFSLKIAVFIVKSTIFFILVDKALANSVVNCKRQFRKKFCGKICFHEYFFPDGNQKEVIFPQLVFNIFAFLLRV